MRQQDGARCPEDPGVKEATVNFMMLKMNVVFEEGHDPEAVMQQVRKNCKRVESDCEVFL